MTHVSEAQHKYHERAPLALFAYHLGAAMELIVHNHTVGASTHTDYKGFRFSIFTKLDDEKLLIYHITSTRKRPGGGWIVEEFENVQGVKVLETILRHICEVEALQEAL